MLSTLGIVHLPVAAAHKAEKLARRLGGKPLLERVVRQVTDCQRIGRVLVLLSGSAEERKLHELVPPDVPVVRSAAPDALSRVIDCLREYPADGVVLVAADRPFVDPVLIDRLVKTTDDHPHCDYISYCLRDGRPAIHSAIGLFAEWCRSEALFRAHREATGPAVRDTITQYIYAHPEIFRVRLIAVPPELDRDDVRLQLDCEEDWEHAQAIFEALGPEGLDWQRIAGLLHNQPALRQRMAVLNQQTSARHPL
jgi:spore coat polysaccharide biosynthesis protein SpsF